MSDVRRQMTERHCSGSRSHLFTDICLLSCDDLVVMARGQNTRAHPELGRENPQRRWYCVLRRGRVGRRQVISRQMPDVRGQMPEPLPPQLFWHLTSVFCPLTFRGVEQPGSSSGS